MYEFIKCVSGNDFLDAVGEIFPQREEYGGTVEAN